jgi:hypothetical protein
MTRYNLYITNLATREREAVVAKNVNENRAERLTMAALSRINENYFVEEEEVQK